MRRGSARSWRARLRPRASPSTSSRDGEQGLTRALAGQLRPGDPGPAAPRPRRARRRCASCIGTSPTLPVLILSARSDLPTKLRGFELGAVDYLAKPFSLDELLARARVQLRRARGRRRRQLISRRRAWCSTWRAARRASATRVADLSDREFRLLHFLCCTSARWSAASGCSRRCGATTSTRARTSSMCACGGCAGGWARRADRDRAQCGLSRCRMTRRGGCDLRAGASSSSGPRSPRPTTRR